MDGSVVDHLLDGWLCSWSLAPFVLLPFLLASYDLPCSSDGFAAPHIHPIVSISLGDLPRTCTSDMHLGHVPWTCTLDATCHTLCHPGACMPHLGPVPRSPTLDPRTPLDPHCLEMPARKGKGAVGWAGLGAGRAPVSRWALRRVRPPRLVGSPGFPVPPPRVVLAPPQHLACPDWQSPCSPATSGGRRRRHAHALRPVAAPGWQALYHTI